MTVGTTRLADAESPSANFFGSRVTAGGRQPHQPQPRPALNNLGVDAKVVDAPGVVPNGATSANVTFSTTGDFYYPAALTTQIDLYAPTINGTKTVTNLSGNSPAKVGDTLEYTMTFTNSGDDNAIELGGRGRPARPTRPTCPGSLPITRRRQHRHQDRRRGRRPGRVRRGEPTGAVPGRHRGDRGHRRHPAPRRGTTTRALPGDRGRAPRPARP